LKTLKPLRLGFGKPDLGTRAIGLVSPPDRVVRYASFNFLRVASLLPPSVKQHDTDISKVIMHSEVCANPGDAKFMNAGKNCAIWAARLLDVRHCVKTGRVENTSFRFGVLRAGVSTGLGAKQLSVSPRISELPEVGFKDGQISISERMQRVEA
jgi:hypothetical protein